MLCMQFLSFILLPLYVTRNLTLTLHDRLILTLTLTGLALGFSTLGSDRTHELIIKCLLMVHVFYSVHGSQFTVQQLTLCFELTQCSLCETLIF